MINRGDFSPGMKNKNEIPRVVILGDGFGGLTVAKALVCTPAEILLLDRNNYHTFLPLLYQIEGKHLISFRYKDPGTMVTIGRNAAAVKFGKMVVTGFSAWIVWLSVHLVKLIGFRNRLLVLINWAGDYLLYEHAVRLILPSGKNISGADK